MKCIASGKSLHKLSMSVIFDSHYMDSMTTYKLKYFFSENYTFSRMDKDVSYVIVIENNLLKKGGYGCILNYYASKGCAKPTRTFDLLFRLLKNA